MKIIKPTTEDQLHLEDVSVFLAGSIEMGAAEDWQVELPKHFEDVSVTFYNPRRDEWDSSWKQEQTNPQFNYQVNWELNKLEDCDLIFLYLSPGTQSPISLLELGIFANSEKVIVCCPDGFWRKGNVEIVCARYNIPMYNTMEQAIGALRTKISQRIES
jgi:hypothetical protein